MIYVRPEAGRTQVALARTRQGRKFAYVGAAPT